MNNVKNPNAARALAIGVVAALVIVGTAMGEVSRTGLVGEWHFDGDAKDSSGNGNDGTIYGATFVDGISGKALSFNGVSDYVYVGDPASGILDFGAKDSFTIEAWGKTNTFANFGYFVNKWQGGNPGYHLRFSATDFNFALYDGSVAGGYHDVYATYPITKASVSTGTWFHLVGVRDVANDRMRLYINGKEYATVTDTTVQTLASNTGLFIGRHPDGAKTADFNDYFNGLIDEVRIYNRALSASEIQAEYNALTSTPIPTTVPPTTVPPTTVPPTTVPPTTVPPTTVPPTTVPPTTPVPTTPTTAGSLSISSTPSGASIFLDGSSRGKTPKDITDVSIGSHYIELKLDDYKPWSDTIDVKAGSTSYVSVPLAPLSTVTATTTPTYTATPTPTPSKPSVSLHGDKTDVVLGEDIILKLSALNLITKPKMHVQVIIIPPSGMSVTSSEFSKVMAGQFAANYELEPGEGKDIEVRIKSNQAGQFNVDGRVVYYFGDDKDTGGDSALSLPIKVREVASAQNPAPNSTPGFGSAIGIIGILFTTLLKRRRG